MNTSVRAQGAFVVAFTSSLVLPACVGQISPGPTPSDHAGATPARGEDRPVPAADPAAPWQETAGDVTGLPAWAHFPSGAPAPVPARIDRHRMPHLEQSLQRAFGPTFSLAGLPDDPYVANSQSLSAGLRVSQFFLREYLDRVATAAPAWVARHGKCATELAATACARDGARLFWAQTRAGELDPSVVAPLDAAIAAAAAKGASRDEVVQTAVLLVAAHPAFLFVIDGERPTQARRAYLDRVATLLWNEPVGDALLRAAEGRDLERDADRQAFVAVLAASPKIKQGVVRLVEEVTGVSQIATLAKEAAQFPFFTDTFRKELRAELTAFVDDAHVDGALPLPALFTRPARVSGAATGKVYGAAAATGAKFERVGLATHPAVIASLGEIQTRNLVKRGKQVLQTYFCFDPPPPPPGLDTTPPEAEGASPATFRQLVEQHSKDPTCASCHRFLDPPGFALEAFDPAGRATTEDGDRLDTSGTLRLPDAPPIAFGTAAELSRALANHSTVARCFVRHAFRAAFGTVEGEGQGPFLVSLNRRFEETNRDLAGLLTTIAAHPYFYARGR